MKKRILSLLWAGLLTLSLTGCWEEEPDDLGGALIPENTTEEPLQEEETEVLLPLSFTLPYDPSQTLDPITCADGIQQVVGSLLYEGLFQLDTQLEPQPCLCEHYAYDPETFTYVFTLRSGVTFSDGTALTAADAATSLQRAKSSQRYGARLSQMVSVSGEGTTLTVVLSHFKGHAMGGFGGAIKNMSIGIASANGKRYIHSAGKTSTSWSGAAQDDFLESMAEAAKAVADHCKENILYISVANNLSVDCDCDSSPADPEMGDIGILASLDPVALDRACTDLVRSSEDHGKIHLIERIDSRNGMHTLDYAEQIGLGSQTYELVRLD